MISRRQFGKFAGALFVSSGLPRVAAARQRERITVVGIGGAGCNIVERLRSRTQSGHDVVRYTVNRVGSGRESDADLELATGCCAVPPPFGYGFYAGAASTLSSRDAERVRAAVAGSRQVILVSGMGGVTGTSLTPLFAQAAKTAGAEVGAVLTLPFEFEGHRVASARVGTARVAEIADRMVLLDNNKLLNEVGEDVTMTKALRWIDGHAIRAIASFIWP